MDSDDDSDSFERGSFVGREDDYDEESRSSSLFDDDDEEDMTFYEIMRGVHQNSPYTTAFEGGGEENWIQNMSNGDWELLGRGLSNNTRLETVRFYGGALSDQTRVAFLFRGLTRSSSIGKLSFCDNELSVAGVQSMVPFLQHANSLRELNLSQNNLQSDGFNMLFRALRNSPIERLTCCSCGIASIQIDTEHIPEHLTYLNLNSNIIDADGCRGLVELLQREDSTSKLLQGGDSTLNHLCLNNNTIDNEGVTILVDALQNNTSLTSLNLLNNDGISNHGMTILLKLVNDVSSIKATLQSNHTLEYMYINPGEPSDPNQKIQTNIKMATNINVKNRESSPEAAGREKVIQTQLHVTNRVELCRLQDVNHSVYRGIDPLHLPEVLSLISRHHGCEELYLALSSSIMILFSTVNMKKCILQERAYHTIREVEYRAIAAEHAAKVQQLDAKLAAMEEEEAAAGNEGDTISITVVTKGVGNSGGA
eukprot:scaffold2421_cov145-Skeletonema_marinoi.AAC.11